MNSASSLLEDIRNVNLSYLLLVQRLLNEDRDQAMFRLKISAEMANVLSGLPISELAKLASSSQLLCHFSLGSVPADLRAGQACQFKSAVVPFFTVQCACS